MKVLSDGWTAVTRDRSLSAQFEHTIGVTETGCEIFTLSPSGRDNPLAAANERGGGRAARPVRPAAAPASRIISATASACAPALQEAGAEALPDYELLELLLFRSIPQRDVKPLAKELIARFGSFAEVLGAPVARLTEVKGVGEGVALDLKIVEAAMQRMAKGAIAKRPCCPPGPRCSTIAARRWPSPSASSSASSSSTRRTLIADEVQQTGTVDHTPVYPREVVRRALELSATALILVHNHPSGDPRPLGRRYPDDARAGRDRGKLAGHRHPRPCHRRPRRTCQFQTGPVLDLKSFRPGIRHLRRRAGQQTLFPNPRE